MEQGISVVHNTDDNNNDSDDVLILSEKISSNRRGSTSSNPIFVDRYYAEDAIVRISVGLPPLSPIPQNSNDNGDHNDVIVLYGNDAFPKKGFNKNNPIVVEKYPSIQQGSIRNRKSERAIDLTLNDYSNFDKDDVQLIDSNPSKILKGDSSNSKNNGGIDYGVDDTTFVCDICVDKKPMSENFGIMGCNHSFCSDCISKYVASKLQENISNIRCPAMGCEGKLEPHQCISILPRQVFDRWGDALCEALILASEKFYCPFKDCSSLLINDLNVGGVTLQSECPDCHRLFCAQCKVAWHSEVSCEEYQKLDKDEREREDILLKKLVKKEKWMRCPKCRIYVQRYEGCLFMTCRCQCTFCYNCGAEAKNHYCNKCKH